MIISSLILFLIQYGNGQFIMNNPDSLTNGTVRSCYFTNWAISRERRAKFTPEDYAPGLCTHIFYAFAIFNDKFEATSSDPNDLPNDSDPKGLYARVVGLKKYDPNLKVILSFGGWTFSQTKTLFKDMTSNPSNRAKFVKSAIDFVKKYKFDGIEIDYEFPNSKENFNSLLMELFHASFIGKQPEDKLLITAAVTGEYDIANHVKTNYDIANISNNVDFIHLMTYDFHISSESTTGYNSPLITGDPLNIVATARYWYQGGMPKCKIVLGFPTYGHGWTLSNPKMKYKGVGSPASGPAKATKYLKDPGTGAYFELCEMLSNGATRVFDNSGASVPYLYQNDQWFSYDDVESFKKKLKWLKNEGYRGAFVWALDYDNFNGKCPGNNDGIYPLIGSIAKSLGNIKGPFVSVADMIKSGKTISATQQNQNQDNNNGAGNERN